MRTAPYFTALGLLTILHAWRVIQLRKKHKVSLGDGGVPELLLATRVFGNHIEYAALGLVLLAALEFVQAPAWYLHLAGATLLIGRLLHALGLETGPATRGRIAGMLFTFASLFLASIGVTLFTFVSMN